MIEVARIVKQVVGAFGRQSLHLIAFQRYNTPISKGLLLENRVRFIVPASGFKSGSHVFSTGLRLVHTPAFLLFLVALSFRHTDYRKYLGDLGLFLQKN